MKKQSKQSLQNIMAEYKAVTGSNVMQQLEQLVGPINSRFSNAGWIPIHYIFRSLDNTQLLAHYRTSEIAFITPLRDGMNLVAKEYCACSIDNNGVLILSEFAGAADELGEKALLVNPYDIEKTADTIYQAFTMPLEERQQRMQWLRNQVQKMMFTDGSATLSEL